jgi:hypothetical protein
MSSNNIGTPISARISKAPDEGPGSGQAAQLLSGFWRRIN